MVSAKFFAVSALAARAVQAATPASWEYTPPVTANLTLTFLNNTVVNPPGELIAREVTAQPPTIQVNTTLFPTNATGLIVTLDLDVARNGTRMPLLHWLVPNVKNINGTLSVPVPSADNTTEPHIPAASFAQPSPPPGDSPHRYVFVLFLQPTNFTFPASFAAYNPPTTSVGRLGFNLTQFIADAKLPTTAIAANYIQVQNTTTAATTSYPPISTASATNAAATSKASAASASSSSSTAGAYVKGVEVGALGAGLMGLAALLL